MREGAQPIDRLDLLSSIFDHLPVGVIVAQAPSGRLVLGTPEVERIWRHPFLEAAAVGEYAAYHGFHRDGRPYEPHEWPLARSITTGEVVRGEIIEIARGDGTRGLLSVDSRPVHDEAGAIVAGVVVFDDVTEREQNRRALELLAQTGRLLEQALDIDVRLSEVAQLCVPVLGDGASVFIIAGDGSITRNLAAATERVTGALRRALPSRVDPAGETPVARAIRTGRAQVVDDVTEEALRDILGPGPETDRALREVLPMSLVALPMRARGRTIGAIVVFTAARRRVYTEAEVATAVELSRRCALAIEHARLFRLETRVRRALEASLRPAALPEIPGVAIADLYLPAEGDTVVGGDFYDLFETADGWGLVFGDVSGKGAPAAALTSLARHTTRAAALVDPRPRAVLELLNRAVRRSGADQFCSVIYAQLRRTPEGLEVTMATGGHPPPVVVDAAGAHLMGISGTVIGAFAEPELGELTCTAAPGEVLLFYTDGVTEARASDGLLGEERLMRIVEASPPSPGAVIDAVIAGLDAAGAVRRDDLALVALQPV